MKSFKNFLFEGGNIKLNNVKAVPIESRNRRHIASELNNFFTTLHRASGNHVFGREENIANGEIYSGSSKHLVDSKISDSDLNKYKPHFGDVDVVVPPTSLPHLKKHLTPGTRHGNFEVLNSTHASTQSSALIKHTPTGNVHQIDFEYKPHDKHGDPTEFAKWSQSSSFDDLKHGIKGKHKSFLMSALTAAKSFGKGKVGKEPIDNIEQYTYSVNHGLREKNKRIGKGVYSEIPKNEHKYEQHVPTIMSRLFGKTLSDSDMKQTGSFKGLTSLIHKHFSDEEKARVFDKFDGRISKEKDASEGIKASKYLRNNGKNLEEHYDHPEDLMVNKGNAGKKGLFRAINSLKQTHALMSGEKDAAKNIGFKADGAMGMFFGKHGPDHPTHPNQHFVSTKRILNKNPVLAHNDKEIETKFADNPAIIPKLKNALAHIPKILKTPGVYQGEYLHDNQIKKINRDKVSFKPMTTEYNIDSNSPEGIKAIRSKLGLAIHTQFDPKTMEPNYHPDASVFHEHPDVHVINPNNVNAKVTLTDRESKVFHGRLAKALSQKVNFDDLKKVPDLRKHINQNARTSGFNRAVDVSHLGNDSSNLDKFFAAHRNIERAKNVLVRALNRSKDVQSYGFKTGDKPSGPEGFTVTKKSGNIMKLVRKNVWTKAHADHKKPIEESTEKHIVMFMGRMNPPNSGHEENVKHILKRAKSLNADHKIILTRSRDNKKNPLSPEQKIKHAGRAWPNANVVVANKGENIYHHLEKAENEGYTHCHFVTGDDRLDKFKEVAARYRGKMNINVESGNHRESTSDPRAAISSTKLREFARNGDYKNFSKYVPDNINKNPKHTKELFDDVRKGMTK